MAPCIDADETIDVVRKSDYEALEHQMMQRLRYVSVYDCSTCTKFVDCVKSKHNAPIEECYTRLI